MTRDDWRSLAVMSALALLICCTGAAWAAEQVCSPKRFYCWQVVAASKLIGEVALRERAKACGWSDAKIEAAARCLK